MKIVPLIIQRKVTMAIVLLTIGEKLWWAADRHAHRIAKFNSGQVERKRRMKKIFCHLLAKIKAHFQNNEEKVFCISMQKTGTTSVGKFFRDFGYKWSGWDSDEKNDWSNSWYEGNYEDIFLSKDFNLANAFEDSPWFFPDFYKILYHKFPNAKFILFTRDSNSWFQSMVKYSRGNVIGSSIIHCKIYRRELEYFDLKNSGEFDENIENQIYSEKKMKIVGHEKQYLDSYARHTIEVQDFFRRHAPDSLFVGTLEDPDKWQKLGKFLGVKVPDDYTSHENVSESKILP